MKGQWITAVRFGLVALLAGGALWGCGGGGDDAPATATATAAAAVTAASQPSTSRQDAQGYVLSTAIWKQLQIPVCWVNPSPANTTERGWVRSTVARTWQRNSQVSFTGWGTCPQVNQSNAIRIAISDVNPSVAVLGKYLVSEPEGMLLDFTFADWGPYCATDPTVRRQCIESIAAHEFGHALGLAHEQNRPDTPTASCFDAPQGTDGDVMVGAWDLQSVMNYCNPTYNNAGALSATDVVTVQRYYKAPLKDTNFSFDAAFYLSLYPDVQASVGNDQQAALNHWNSVGLKAGRRASREFDVVYYINAYPDLRRAFGTNYVAARDHWIHHGIAEGRRGSREVSASYYLSRYADLRAAYGSNYRAALSHWVNTGLAQQRQASPDFNIANYFARYNDLRLNFRYTNSFTTYANDSVLGFLHWVRYGFLEGRNGR